MTLPAPLPPALPTISLPAALPRLPPALPPLGLPSGNAKSSTLPVTVDRSRLEWYEAAWQLHVKQGGGWIPTKDIDELSLRVIMPLRKMPPPLPPALPPPLPGALR